MTETNETTKRFVALLTAIAAPCIVSLITASAVYWVESSQSRARSDEIHSRLSDDVLDLRNGRQRDIVTLQQLGRDVAVVQDTLERGNRETSRRLSRIESHLDRTGR